MVFFGYKNGAEGQNRTAHTGIFSPLLYQLSYLGTTRGNLHIIFRLGKHFFVLQANFLRARFSDLTQ